MNVTIIGLGYVGLVNAAVLASLGHKVRGFDINESKIKSLQNGIPTINEPRLSDLMKSNEKNLLFTADIEEALKIAEVVLVAVNTPSKEDGSCDLTHLSLAIQMISENIDHDAVVVIRSTVPVGTNRKIKEIFKKKAKHHLFVASNPEFLSQGHAVEDMYNPSRIIIGTDEPEAHLALTILYEDYYLREIPMLFTSFESAELIKYAANTYLAMRISFINEMALFCDLVNADIDMVAKGIGLDPRIGSSFLKAGLGYGGSCFPKDSKALNWMSTTKGRPLELVRATIKINKTMPEEFVKRIVERFNGSLKGINIAALGLSFKGETSDVRKSQSIDVIKLLLNNDANVIAYDQYAEEEFQKEFGKHPKLKYVASIKDAIKNADAVAILNDASEFKELNQHYYVKTMKNSPLIFDGRNIYKPDDFNDVEYHSFGRGKKHKYIEKGPKD